MNEQEYTRKKLIKLKEELDALMEICLLDGDRFLIFQGKKVQKLVSELLDLNCRKFNVQEAALLLNVSTKTVLRKISSGLLKADKIGKKYFLNENQFSNKFCERNNDKTMSLNALEALGLIKGEIK